MGSCIFNTLEAPGPLTDIGILLGALFCYSSATYTLQIPCIHEIQTDSWRFEIGSLTQKLTQSQLMGKKFLAHTSF